MATFEEMWAEAPQLSSNTRRLTDGWIIRRSIAGRQCWRTYYDQSQKDLWATSLYIVEFPGEDNWVIVTRPCNSLDHPQPGWNRVAGPFETLDGARACWLVMESNLVS